MRLIKGSLAGLVLTGILAMMPAAAFAHGGGGGGGGGHGGEVAVTEVEDTLLSVVVVTDSVVVTHLADSPAVALVRDSAGRGDFLLVDFLVAEITAALVTVVSVDGIATFAILMRAFSISAAPALDIQMTPTITHIRTTTTMGI
jgi:hypothetical protein